MILKPVLTQERMRGQKQKVSPWSRFFCESNRAVNSSDKVISYIFICDDLLMEVELRVGMKNRITDEGMRDVCK